MRKILEIGEHSIYDAERLGIIIKKDDAEENTETIIIGHKEEMILRKHLNKKHKLIT